MVGGAGEDRAADDAGRVINAVTSGLFAKVELERRYEQKSS
jgi:hypothetical protein